MAYKLSDYGANANAGASINGDNGWGPHKWPAGVPRDLLAVAPYTYGGQAVRVTVRRELVELFVLAFRLAEKHDYQIFAKRNGEVWGPWSYENRPIGGTQSASNHSRGRAIDVNAPFNPQSFTFQSDMPPAMVRAWESIGLCWGGRYGGGTKLDTMHFEYGYTPGHVAGHAAKARQLLGIGNAPVGVPDRVNAAGAGGAFANIGGAVTRDWLTDAPRAAVQAVFETSWGND